MRRAIERPTHPIALLLGIQTERAEEIAAESHELKTREEAVRDTGRELGLSLDQGRTVLGRERGKLIDEAEQLGTVSLGRHYCSCSPHNIKVLKLEEQQHHERVQFPCVCRDSTSTMIDELSVLLSSAAPESYVFCKRRGAASHQVVHAETNPM